MHESMNILKDGSLLFFLKACYHLMFKIFFSNFWEFLPKIRLFCVQYKIELLVFSG